MWLEDVYLENCRVIPSLELSLDHPFNVICGANGVGKTSILEGLSLLSTGKSFRSSSIKHLIKNDQPFVLARAKGKDDAGLPLSVGIKRSNSQTAIRINRKTVYSQSALSGILPVTFIHPVSQNLLLGGASYRRRMLDWIAFYNTPEFHNLWTSYQKVVKQRNVAFKSSQFHFSLESLTHQMCELLPKLYKARIEAFELLGNCLHTLKQDFIPDVLPTLQYLHRYPEDILDNQEALFKFHMEMLAREKRQKRTLVGFHKDDIKVTVEEQLAKEFCSRGQIRLISILLLVAQNQTVSGNKIIAFDDISSELDVDNQNMLIKFLSSVSSQLIITSTSGSLFKDYDTNMFHVKPFQ